MHADIIPSLLTNMQAGNFRVWLRQCAGKRITKHTQKHRHIFSQMHVHAAPAPQPDCLMLRRL